MEELMQVNSNLVRNPNQIAAEISQIKNQTRNMVIYNSIEIGRRLSEAKLLLDHGSWGPWLDQLSYSKSTANNLMRIFDEYGSDQLVLIGDNTKSEAYQKLNYTQAVALLGMPDEEREAFIDGHDMETISTRELQAAIKERDQAIQDKLNAEKSAEKANARILEAEKSKKELDEKLKNFDAEKKKIQDDFEKSKIESEKLAKQALEDAKKALNEQKTKAAEMQKQIKEFESKPMTVHSGATEEDIAKARMEVESEYKLKLASMEAEKQATEKQIRELESKVDKQNNEAAIKYSVHFENLVKDFGGLLATLSDIKLTDVELHDRYKKAVVGLIEKMKERL